MRPIKFRAWTDGKMYKNVGVVGNIVVLEYESSEEWNDVDLEPTYYGVRDDSIQLMQFTGLKDKNGREIYEGDILSCNETAIVLGKKTAVKVNKVVVYSEEYAQYFLNKGKSNEHLTFAGFYEAEVIGNTYENQDLI